MSVFSDHKGATLSWQFTGVLSPPSIGSNQNDYNPTGLSDAVVLRLTASSSYSITGLAGGVSGRLIVIHNIGSNTITLSNQSTSSAAANRFLLGSDRAIAADESYAIIYDSTTSRWRPLVTASAASGSTPEKGVVFHPYEASYPSSNFPQLTKVNQRPVLAFDDTTDETCYWETIARTGLTVPLTLHLYLIMASATTGATGWQVQVEAVTSGDATDLGNTTSFDTVNNSSSTTVPATAGYLQEISITLTNNDSFAAGDYLRLAVNRDANSSAVTDSATGDAYLLFAYLEGS
jgi:hypothetical protein